MFTKLKIALIAIIVLAVIVGIKAFWFVFTGILYYGGIALAIAAGVYAYYRLKDKGQDTK